MANSVAQAIQKLLPSSLPPSLSSRPGRLYAVLSRYSKDGVGQRVHQTRWGMKGMEDCYWEVTRAKMKLGGTHGKAWGRLVWKGASLPPRLVCGILMLWNCYFRQTRQYTRGGDPWWTEVYVGTRRVSSPTKTEITKHQSIIIVLGCATLFYTLPSSIVAVDPP